MDSCDVERVATSKEEFHAILEEEEVKDAFILVYANKQVHSHYRLYDVTAMRQDLPGALDDAAIAEGLGLHQIKNRDWAIFKTSAIKGEGIFEGLDWLSSMLKR